MSRANCFPASDCLLAADCRVASQAANVLGWKGPRKMKIVIPAVVDADRRYVPQAMNRKLSASKFVKPTPIRAVDIQLSCVQMCGTERRCMPWATEQAIIVRPNL